MPHIHVTEPIHPDGMTLLRDAGVTLTLGWEGGEAPMAQADAWLVRTFAVTAEGMAAAPNLRIVSKHGVGVDNIPLADAAAAGVVVTNTPGANAGAVAEHALMLMLGLSRGVLAMDRSARDGFSKRFMPDDLEGKRVLLLGYGAIGRRIAALCAAFGMQVTIWHRRMDAAEAGFTVVRDLAQGLAAADVLSVQLPLNAGTRGLIGAAQLALLPEGAILVNVGRGGIVDEAALVAAAPRLGGVGLDVFAHEPLPQDDPLLALPRTLFTPHAAGMSTGAMRAMGMRAAQNILDHLAGRLDPAARMTPA